MKETQQGTPLLSIVLPVFNEEENIQLVYQELIELFEQKLSDYPYEIIFVNDGSRDKSVEIIKQLGDANHAVRLISFSRNFGYQAALMAGLQKASGHVIITMDADLQHPVEVIPRLLGAWKDGNPVVYARRKRVHEKISKTLTSKVYGAILNKLSDIKIPKNITDFRLLDRVVVDQLINLREHARFLRGLIAWLGYDYTFVDYEQPEREFGETRYTFRTLLRIAMDGLLSFSMLPLRFGLWLGITSIILSIIFFMYISYNFFILGVNYQLYKWINVVVFGFIGLQFIFLWLLGEYIGRIYGNVRGRPLYITKEEYNFDS